MFGNVSVMWFELLLFVLFELFKLCSIFCFYSVFDLCYVMILWLRVTVLFTSLPESLFWSQLLGSDLKRTVALWEAFEEFFCVLFTLFLLFCFIFCVVYSISVYVGLMLDYLIEQVWRLQVGIYGFPASLTLHVF